MGRKTAIILGSFLMFATNLVLGAVVYIPKERPYFFVAVSMTARLIQGLGDSLVICA
jgi:hypothetical protein